MTTVDVKAPAMPEAAARLDPLGRLEILCDPNSLNVVRSGVKSHRMGDRAVEGDGVVTGSGTVGGRPIFCFAEDRAFAGGSLGEAHAASILRIMELAGEARIPVVGFVESAGARMQEGTAALGGYARLFRKNVELSGRVPQISISTGTSAGGGCYSPALTDFVVMTSGARMFLTGPQVVREVLGEDISPEALGGPRVHARNGVAQFVVADEFEAASLARELLGYLPQNGWERPPRSEPGLPLGGDPGEPVPAERSRSFDVREVIRRIVDAGQLLEVSPRWARNIVIGLARLDGHPVGVVANQPRHLGGILDAEAAQKAARFVRMCNCYSLPLVVLADTPGFLPGIKQESLGIIRHGAKLLHAFAEASVPKITVVLRHAYGGGYITMNSRELGADFAFAWPDAMIGVMGAQQAVSIIHRREIAAAAEPAAKRAELAGSYANDQQRAQVAAHEGAIDEVITPGETRPRLIAALAVLRAKQPPRPAGRNIPL